MTASIKARTHEQQATRASAKLAIKLKSATTVFVVAFDMRKTKKTKFYCIQRLLYEPR